MGIEVDWSTPMWGEVQGSDYTLGGSQDPNWPVVVEGNQITSAPPSASGEWAPAWPVTVTGSPTSATMYIVIQPNPAEQVSTLAGAVRAGLLIIDFAAQRLIAYADASSWSRPWGPGSETSILAVNLQPADGVTIENGQWTLLFGEFGAYDGDGQSLTQPITATLSTTDPLLGGGGDPEEPASSDCVWKPDPACLGTEWSELDPEVQDRSLRLATSALQMLTLYRVGTCPITIRPCPTEPRCGCGWNPHIRDGQWYNDCAHGATCSPISEYAIPGPVGYVDELRIDGAVVDLTSGDWRLDDGHLLVWQGDGPSPLPETQDLNKPDTEPGTWSITYSRSYPVLFDARIAVAYLAMEFARACKPRAKCSLPKGVTNVVRNGVSFTIEAGLFPGGLTGIEIVDAFILKWAPAGAPSQNAAVFTPRRAKSARISTGIPTRAPLG